MDILEIVLLVIGGVIFILSFIITARKEEVSESTKNLAKSEIETLVSQEMQNIRSHVDEVVEESMEYAIEKTERSLERLSNEKIMAVNEYSDTVLQEIHRNHEEVMFLYDMLNDKHTNLKNTVTEVNQTVKKVAETKKDAEAVVQSFQKLTPDPEVQTFQKLTPEIVIVNDNKATGMDSVGQEGIGFANGLDNRERNYNERIIELFRQGKTNVAIAQELGLGVGEVKLVIDLYVS